MVYSLLYPNDIAADKDAVAACTGSVGPRTLYHLSLDRSVALFSEDTARNAYFLDVLSKPLTSARAIRCRQDVLGDLLNHPNFRHDFGELYDRFLALRDSHEREKIMLMRNIHNVNGSASAQLLFNLLQSAVQTQKRLLQFLSAFEKLFAEGMAEEKPLSSENLTALAKGFPEAVRSEAFEEFGILCREIEKSDRFSLRVSLTQTGQIGDVDMVSEGDLKVKDIEAPKRFAFFRRGKEEELSTCVRVYESYDAIWEKLRMIPMSSLAEIVDSVSDQLFARFAPAGTELAFYDIAIRYVEVMKAKGAITVYPTFGEGAELTALSDLYLILTHKENQAVISNDASAGDHGSGTILFGENNSGKTVYLRSVGTAQLLGQAGLPVPARGAVLPLHTRLVTQFSEAEKEFERGNDAGRFEQEVRELAAVVDTLKPGSFVLLNETFQTTAYAEGAEGLYHILRFFRENGIRYLLVSHLRQLEPMLDRGAVTVLGTRSGFHIVPDGAEKQ
ncbi:MAG: hypothetical protein MJ175_00610 [Clostridia bacterium]|nr:hypothetical protein [Clostridia bacterium]